MFVCACVLIIICPLGHNIFKNHFDTLHCCFCHNLQRHLSRIYFATSLDTAQPGGSRSLELQTLVFARRLVLKLVACFPAERSRICLCRSDSVFFRGTTQLNRKVRSFDPRRADLKVLSRRAPVSPAARDFSGARAGGGGLWTLAPWLGCFRM